MRVCGKKLGFTIVFAILLTVIFSSITFAYLGSLQVGGGDDSTALPDDYNLNSIEAFNQMFELFGGQFLFLELGLACYNQDRDIVENDDGYLHIPIVLYDGVRKYGVMTDYRITEDYDGQELEDFIDSIGTGQDDLEDFTDLSNLDTLEPAFGLYNKQPNSWTETVSVPLAIETPDVSEETESDNPELYRYEGVAAGSGEFATNGCRYYQRLMHVFNLRDLTGESTLANNNLARLYTVHDQERTGYYTDDFIAGEYEHPYDLGVDENVLYFLDDPEYSLNIEWDYNPDQCEIIGGDWLNTGTNDDDYYKSSNYHRACCGDDSIWIRNIQVGYPHQGNAHDFETAVEYSINNEDGSLAYDYCLYGGRADADADDQDYSYRCDSPNTYVPEPDYPYHIPYFIERGYDVDNLDNLLEDPFELYFFEGEGELEVDQGKWSDGQERNPFYCHFYYSEEEGDVYKWYGFNEDSSLGDGMDINPETCEFLGGVWTGSHCCGYRYDYGDPMDTGDGEYINISYSDPEYYFEYNASDGDSEEFGHPSLSSTNPACVNSQVIENGQTVFKNTTSEKEIELLNADGVLLGCNLVGADPFELGEDYFEGVDLIINDRNVSICNVTKTQAGGDYVCGFNSSWHQLGEPYTADDMFWENAYTDTVALSPITWTNTEVQQEECCFGNSCWNGTTCVGETTVYYDGDDQYSCIGSVWIGPLEDSQDWYDYDESALPCPYDYSCVGASEDGQYEFDGEGYDNFCSENEDYLQAGCTQVENFYIEDHYCEYDGSNQAYWTSRTKYIAMQLLAIAEDQVLTEYTLFCDGYDESINYVEGLNGLSDEINSFCVLHTGLETWLGVSINPDFDGAMEYDYDEVEDVLFGNYGLIEGVLAEGVNENDCEDVFINQTGLGTYYGCNDDDDMVWINDATLSVIFNEEGFAYIDELPAFDTSDLVKWNVFFEDRLELIVDFATSDPGAIADEMERIENVNGFSRLFIQYDGTDYVFAFEEPKYDGSSHIKNFMGVLYENQIIDCDTVNEAMEGVSFCTENDGTNNSIIIEKSTSGSVYWTDLTAELRQ